MCVCGGGGGGEAGGYCKNCGYNPVELSHIIYILTAVFLLCNSSMAMKGNKKEEWLETVLKLILPAE